MDRVNNPKYPDTKKINRDARHVYTRNEMQYPLFLDTRGVDISTSSSSGLVFDNKTNIRALYCSKGTPYV